MSWQKRLKHKWQDYKWRIFGLMALITLGLGYIGFTKYYAALGETRTPLDIFYRTLQLLPLESEFVPGPISWELELARLLAPAVAAYAAVIALSMIFKEQLQLLGVRFSKNHVVICGLGRKGLLLAQKFRECRNRVVVIELDKENELLEQCRDYGAFVIIGNARSREVLRKARVHKAKHLISVCGEDGLNAEVAVNARELVRRRKSKVLTCIVHIVDPHLYHLLEEQEVETRGTGNFRLQFFNIFYSGALSWLEDYSPLTDSEGAPVPSPHLLLVGAGRMGESLAARSAKNWHDLSPKPSKKIRITILDRKAELKKESLCLQYPRLSSVCDIISREMEIESLDFQRADFLFDEDRKCKVTSVFVCLDNDSLGLSAALALHQHIKEYKIPIVVRMVRDAGLATLFRKEDKGDESHKTLHAFGLLDRTCQPEQVLAGINEIIAQAIHKDYIRRQEKKGKTPETRTSQVKDIMVSWDELPEGLKESNRQQADHIGEKLKKMGFGIEPLTDWDEKLFEFTEEEIELMAKMEHERWVSERQRSGWRKGPKNIKKKRSPYLVPWEKLDEIDKDIKEEDRAPVRNLPIYLAKADLKIYRRKKGD